MCLVTESKRNTRVSNTVHFALALLQYDIYVEYVPSKDEFRRSLFGRVFRVMSSAGSSA